MALLFTALLVFLVEDSEDAYPHTPSRLDNSHSTSTVDKGKRRSKRLVGLAEQDNEAAERGTDDEESSWAWDPRADAQTTDGDLKMSTEWNRVQKEKMALSGYRYRTTNPRLLASPPPSASRMSLQFSPRYPLDTRISGYHSPHEMKLIHGAIFPTIQPASLRRLLWFHSSLDYHDG